MTNQEKLINFIHNLTNEEADYLISYLTKVQTLEEVSLLLPPNIPLQEQSVAV